MPDQLPLRVALPALRRRLRVVLDQRGTERQLPALDRFALAVARVLDLSTAALRLPVPVELAARAEQASIAALAAPIRAELDALADPAVDGLIEVLDLAGELPLPASPASLAPLLQALAALPLDPRWS